jgi:hypothetical protein
MPSLELIKNLKPFASASGAGIALDALGITATVSGTAPLVSQAFEMERFSSFSFCISYGASTGVTAGAPFVNGWQIQACNDYDPNRPAQFPGTWQDVTASISGGAKPFSDVPTAIAATTNTHFAVWCFPFGALRFVFQLASGSTVLLAQFIAKSV